MRKEIGVAIFFGILLGLTVAVIMIGKIRQIEGNKVDSVQSKSNSSSRAVPTTGNVLDLLEIKEPAQNTIFAKNSATIKGKAPKNALIVIQSQTSEKIFKNSNGSFSVVFPLVLGENAITVTAYPKDTKLNAQEKTLKLYYLDEQ